MKSVIAFKIDKNTNMQWGGAIENTWYAKEMYPLWICRFYVTNLKSDKNEQYLKNIGAEVVHINKTDNWLDILHNDKEIKNLLIKDVESRLCYENNISGELFRHSKQKHIEDKLIPESNVYIYFCQDIATKGGIWIFALLKDIIQYSKYRTTNNINKASIILAICETSIKNFINNHPNADKKYIIYSAEPRLSLIKKGKIIYKRKIIHVMNCYTKNVYISPYHDANHIFKFDHFNYDKLVDKDNFNNQIVIVASNRYSKDMIHDLTKLRYRLVMNAYNKGMITVHGAGWPRGVSKGQSRFIKNIYEHKMNILNKYYFNLCLENTDIDNYVSEKIWHSIISGCLPIYYGNTGIYNIFPKNSFVDCKGKSVPQILSEIKNMTWDIYLRRFKLCYNVVKNIRWIDIINAKTLRKKYLLDKLQDNL